MKYKFLILFFLSFSTNIFCQSPYPSIQNLKITDILFKQYCDGVAESRKAIAMNKKGRDLPIFFYKYTPKKGESIIQIAARCAIPYDAIVTLNRIESADVDVFGKELILPTLPAIYLPSKPALAIEKLIGAFLEKEDIKPLKIKIYSKNKKQIFFCFVNSVFDGTTRAFFFKPFYRFPLQDAVLTSGFGKRASPFSGKPSYHPGIDLAAPTGSPVMACAGGVIKSILYNKVYGKHIIISHTDGRESLYGHLSKVYIRLNEKVKSGTIIGAVGSTGMSTGPHLHFEIRESGVPKNPAKYIEKRN